MKAINLETWFTRIEKLLLEQKEENSAIRKNNLSLKKVLTFDELCEYTGLSRSHLYKLTANSDIPFSKPNGKILFFDKEKIDQWLLENSNQTNTEIELKANQYILNKKR